MAVLNLKNSKGSRFLLAKNLLALDICYVIAEIGISLLYRTYKGIPFFANDFIERIYIIILFNTFFALWLLFEKHEKTTLKCFIETKYLDDQMIPIQLQQFNDTYIINSFNSINNIVIILDTDENIIVCNRALADLVKIDDSTIVGMNIYEFYKHASISVRELRCVTEGSNGILRTLEYIIEKTGGCKSYLLANETLIINDYGEKTGSVIIGTDVTLLKIEQQKAYQNERLIILGQMAAGIVHEIKNPLTVIKGFSQVIKMTDKEEKTLEYVNIINTETERINKVVGDFLKFAKPRQPDLEKVNLSELIDSIKLMVDTNAFVRGIKVNIQNEIYDRGILADKEQLMQVILNIVQNAIDVLAVVDKPKLRIMTGYNRITDEVCISIANNGKPLTNEEKIKMGTPFYTTKNKGTGLGLSICYQIIKEHNGRLEIESREGEDTVFTLLFPNHKEE